MQRILARKVIYDNVEYRMTIIELSDDGSHLRLIPFTEETANTLWVDTTVEIQRADDGLYLFKPY